MMRKRNGQSTVELAVLLAVVVAALLAMGTFMKRGVMGKLQDSTNQIGDQFNPRVYTEHMQTTFTGTRNETTAANGTQVSSVTAEELQTRTGDKHITSSVEFEQLF